MNNAATKVTPKLKTYNLNYYIRKAVESYNKEHGIKPSKEK